MKRVLAVFLFLCIFMKTDIYAEDLDGRLSEYDFSKIESVFADSTGVRVDFRTMVYNAAAGNGSDFFELAKEYFKDRLLGESRGILFSLGGLFITAVLGGFLNNLMLSFGDKDAAETGFAVCYILIVGTGMGVFMSLIGLAEDFCGGISNIMMGGLPLMTALITAGGGPAQAVCYSGIVAGCSGAVTNSIEYIVVPLMKLALIMCIINNLTEEKMLEKLSDTLQSAVSAAIKVCAVGFTFITGLYRLASETGGGLIGKGAKTMVEMVPVAGDIIKGSIDTGMLVLGSIKSGAGIVFIVLLALYASLPVLRVFIAAAAFKLTAGIIEPVCGKRIAGLVDGIGDCSMLILGLMFLVSYVFMFSVLVFAAFAAV